MLSSDPIRCLPWLRRMAAQMTLIQSRNWLKATTRNSLLALATSSGSLVNSLVSLVLNSAIQQKLKTLRKQAANSDTATAIL
ncbi:hypothetical protein OGATHE_001682 [Ogataea polymorpha]|uniref:Uncharacterized protein n=1 Tax=Ogataea polymorpha TaxID=460523 RepID=A0A9P8PPN6_9ASCO|nr:hypothetical protein OGATHE_001682 [Ogataea polymorpha]